MPYSRFEGPCNSPIQVVQPSRLHGSVFLVHLNHRTLSSLKPMLAINRLG